MSQIPRSSIAVGIDGSPSGAQALVWAADEAARRAVPLVVAHAGDLALTPALTSATAAAVVKDLSDYGHQLLADAVATLAETHPTLRVRTELDGGKASRLLVELSRSVDLLVVGHGNERHLTRLLIGTTSSRVAAYAQCPVVLVGAEPYSGTDILVGVSTSPRGIQAMRFACAEAALRDRTVVGIRSWAEPGWVDDYDDYDTAQVWRASQGNLLAQWADQARVEFPDLLITTHLTSLPVCRALAEASSHAELLVLGGSSEVGHEISFVPRLGPVASWAIGHTACPVAVVHPRAADDPCSSTALTSTATEGPTS